MVLSLLSNQTKTETPTPTPIPLIDICTDIDMAVSSPSSHLFLASHNGDLHVFGPCNGIVCITERCDIVLCNPSTREFNTLPLPPFSYPRDMLSGCEAVGFGFDSSANDYKVVRLVSVREDVSDEDYTYDPEFYCPDYTNVEIYNLSTDSWREVDAIVPFDVSTWYPPRFEMLFNGAFHWYRMKPTTIYHGVGNVDNFELILCFDINDEVFRVIQFPPDVPPKMMDGRNRSLLVFSESLALILYGVEKYFDIWVMNEYGVNESWTKQFSIGPLVGINFPLVFWKDGSELLMESCSGQLVPCDFRT